MATAGVDDRRDVDPLGDDEVRLLCCGALICLYDGDAAGYQLAMARMREVGIDAAHFYADLLVSAMRDESYIDVEILRQYLLMLAGV